VIDAAINLLRQQAAQPLAPCAVNVNGSATFTSLDAALGTLARKYVRSDGRRPEDLFRVIDRPLQALPWPRRARIAWSASV
jgi:hypothetical protein